MIDDDDLDDLLGSHAPVLVQVTGKKGAHWHEATLTGDGMFASPTKVARMRKDLGLTKDYPMPSGTYLEVQMEPDRNSTGEPVGGFSDRRMVHVQHVKIDTKRRPRR